MSNNLFAESPFYFICSNTLFYILYLVYVILHLLLYVLFIIIFYICFIPIAVYYIVLKTFTK